MKNRTLTAIPGLRVGHVTDARGGTGCTVVLTEKGATAAGHFPGGAVGSRQVSALMADHVAPVIHAVALSGGSAFGLDAGGGVQAHLEKQGVGLPTPAGIVPVVPTLVIYDLGCGPSDVRPDADMGRRAAESASDQPVEEGSLGAGTGAIIGKLRGGARGTKGGVGTSLAEASNGLLAGALVVLNAFGDVRDPRTDAILAGARDEEGAFVDMRRAIEAGALHGVLPFGQNTTLAVLATNGKLDATGLRRALRIAGGALVECISPVHTLVDGDALVGLSCGDVVTEPHQLGLLWQRALREAILRAVDRATTLHGIPAAHEISGKSENR